MRKTLKVVAFGGGPADAFIKAAGITNSTQQTAIKTLVNDLNGYGLWSKMKAIYPMVGGNATAHSYNLKDTTKFQITWNGGLTHDSNGVLGNGTNGYGNTNLSPNTNLVKYNTHTSIYLRTNTDGIYCDLGASNDSFNEMVTIYSKDSGNAKSDMGNYAISRISAATANSLGNYINSRTANNVFKLYKNSTTLGTNTSTDTNNLPLKNLTIFGINYGASPSQFSNRQCAFSTIGEGLSDTEAANLYTSIQKFQTTLNRFVGTPIYPSFDSDAQSFMTSASITDSTQQAAVNYLVTDLKSNNLWTKMKAVYPMVGGNATSHSYNLKNPSQFQITWNGGLTHSSNGVLPNGTTGYGNTNFNPSSNITTNSAHHSFYFKTNRSIYQTAVHGAYQSNQLDMALYPYAFNIGWINDIFDNSTSRLTISTGDSTGYVIGTRSSSSSHKLFRNNTQIASTTSATTGTPPNANYFIGALNYLGSANYFDNNQIAMATIGDGLTDTDASNLYTIIQNYQTILSRQV